MIQSKTLPVVPTHSTTLFNLKVLKVFSFIPLIIYF